VINLSKNGTLELITVQNYLCEFKKKCLNKKIVTVKHNDIKRHINCSSHKLEIKTGIYNCVTRENKIGNCCPSCMIETEFIFLLWCTMYKELRVKYLKNTPWPTLQMFECLMSTNSSKKLLSIARFINDAYVLRDNSLVG